MERIGDVGGYGDKVRMDNGRLCIQREDGTKAFVALDDMAVLMLSEPGLSVSGAVMAELMNRGATAVVCDRSHVPVGVLQPLAAHSRHVGFLLGQIAARPLLRARLWQRIIQAKIAAQARTLARYGRRDSGVEAMAGRVRRGDPDNAEGHAALRYWRRLGIFERRDRFADDANRPLNYAYAILHGATVRALCGAGLNTALGVSHCNPTNPHCLASDLMEPFRAAADSAVYDWLTSNPGDYGMSAASRRFLLRTLLASRWKTAKGGRLSFFDALSHAAVSLRECLLSNSVELDIPVQTEEGDEDVDACAV